MSADVRYALRHAAECAGKCGVSLELAIERAAADVNTAGQTARLQELQRDADTLERRIRAILQ